MFKVFTVVFIILISMVFSIRPIHALQINSLISSKIAISNSPDVLIPAVQGPSVIQDLKTRTQSAWPWYITRASGIIAAILLVILILSGVGLITGYSFKVLEPLNAWASHRAIGISFFVAVLIHGGSLLFDHYVPFSLIQVFMPFMSHYRTVTFGGYHLGSLWVALGIFAFYGLLAVIISSLLWIDKKPYSWKFIHFLAYIIMIFVFIHALYLGTDLAHGILRTLWIVFGVIVAIAIIYRLNRARSI